MGRFDTSTSLRTGFDKLKLPLVVRFLEDGDRFELLGLSGHKKEGKFLTPTKLPQEVRAKVFIVADV
jgi:tRNA(Ile)-lysidine synthetase-like protein